MPGRPASASQPASGTRARSAAEACGAGVPTAWGSSVTARRRGVARRYGCRGSRTRSTSPWGMSRRASREHRARSRAQGCMAVAPSVPARPCVSSPPGARCARRPARHRGQGACACAVDRGGAVTCWGGNQDGAATGVASGPTGAVAVAGVRDAVGVAAGSLSTCAVTRGAMSCAGARADVADWATERPSRGFRLRGPSLPSTTPSPSRPPDRTRARCGATGPWFAGEDASIAARAAARRPRPRSSPACPTRASWRWVRGETCVLRAGDGGVACWTEQKSASAIPGLVGAVSVAAGQRFACAAAGGKVSCWGDNLDGTLGNGDRTWFPEPVDVEGIDDAIEVSTAEHGSCARRKSGKVSCWGGSAADARVPLDVRGLDDATRLFVGFDRVCATRAGGAPVCFSARRTEPGVGPAAAELGLQPTALRRAGSPRSRRRQGTSPSSIGPGTRPSRAYAGRSRSTPATRARARRAEGPTSPVGNGIQGGAGGRLLHGKPIAIRPKTIGGHARRRIHVAMYGRACALLVRQDCVLPSRGRGSDPSCPASTTPRSSRRQAWRSARCTGEGRCRAGAASEREARPFAATARLPASKAPSAWASLRITRAWCSAPARSGAGAPTKGKARPPRAESQRRPGRRRAPRAGFPIAGRLLASVVPSLW